MFTLGRTIDLRYKPNVIIILVTLIVFTIRWLSTGDVLSGLSIGDGVFLTWALSRELDPAHDYSAFISVALSFFMLLYSDSIQLLVVSWLLLLLRGVNGIAGSELTSLDVFSLFGLTVFLSFDNENSIFLFIFVLAFVFIIRTGTKTKEIWIAGALGSVLFLIQNVFMNSLTLNRIGDLTTLTQLLIIFSVLSPVLFWFLSHIETEDDKGNKANRSKLFAGQLLYSVAVLLLVLTGNLSINDIIIYLSVIIGLSIYFVGNKQIKPSS